MPYMKKSNFISQDPELRQRQLANLVQNRMKRARMPAIQKSKVIIEDIPEGKIIIEDIAGWNIEIKIIKK